MKSFKLSIIFCAITSGASLFGDNNAPQADWRNPSDYVTELLENSTTLYRGSDDWKISMQKDGATARTKFTRSGTDADVQGVLNAEFDLKNHNGLIEINTTITGVQTDKAASFDKLPDIVNSIAMPAEQSDAFTRCLHKRKLFFDEKTQRSAVQVTTTCTSKMPGDFAELLAMRKAFKDNFPQQSK